MVAHLPLRNLHWKAPTRPLRSIDSLHVDLVPSPESAQAAGAASSAVASGQGTPKRTTEEIFRAPNKEKERRHQIPGLRQTPYLRIYLLRCDDSDTYKSTARKLVREWVKDHTPPSQSSTANTQENHDAYEWMILHVVLPNTSAASQPHGSSSTATGEKEKSGPASRWTRGTTTLLEKLRADFNVSSKSAPDRVAQIRVPKERVPPHMIPAAPPASSPVINEGPQEQDRAWADVIARFKVLILLSFDLRTRQSPTARRPRSPACGTCRCGCTSPAGFLVASPHPDRAGHVGLETGRTRTLPSRCRASSATSKRSTSQASSRSSGSTPG